MHVDRSIIPHLRAGMAGEIQGRRVADAHEQEIGGEGLRCRPCFAGSGHRRDHDMRQALAAFAVHRRMALDHRDVGFRSQRIRLRRAIGQIDNRRDLYPRLDAIQRRLIAKAIAGRDDSAFARLNPIKPDQPLRRIREHDARTVIVVKDNRLIEAAGREHDLLARTL